MEMGREEEEPVDRVVFGAARKLWSTVAEDRAVNETATLWAANGTLNGSVLLQTALASVVDWVFDQHVFDVLYERAREKRLALFQQHTAAPSTCAIVPRSRKRL